jgi:hypothetical protein
MCPIMSQAITAKNPIAQMSGSSGSTSSRARVTADNGGTMAPSRSESCAAGASFVAAKTALVAVALPPINPKERDEPVDRGEAVADPGSFANDGAVANARGNTGTSQAGDIHIATGSSALMARVPYRLARSH